MLREKRVHTPSKVYNLQILTSLCRFTSNMEDPQPIKSLVKLNYPFRRFLLHSKLHHFLSVKEPNLIRHNERYYLLEVVFSALRNIIGREKLYDPKNPSCIIASPEMEECFDVKMFHITQIRDFVLSQMELPTYEERVNAARCAWSCERFDVNARYAVKPDLLKVLRSVPSCHPTAVIFRYREITELLSKYISSNKDKFFDNRNILMAHIEGYPLEDAFGVKVFHRTQVTQLLRTQLLLLSQRDRSILDQGMKLRNGKLLLDARFRKLVTPY